MVSGNVGPGFFTVEYLSQLVFPMNPLYRMFSHRDNAERWLPGEQVDTCKVFFRSASAPPLLNDESPMA